MRIEIENDVVNIRKEDRDIPNLAVEELKKEKAKREKLEEQMAAVLQRLNMGEG